MEGQNMQETKAFVEREFFRLLQTDLYAQKVQDMIGLERPRLDVNLDDLRNQDLKLPGLILKHPLPLFGVLEEVLAGVVKDAGAFKKRQRGAYRINAEGSFGENYVTPRGLKSTLANQLVKVQGIVSRMSLVRPKLMQSVHYCEATGAGHIKTYGNQYELTSGSEHRTESNTVPMKDSSGNPLHMEFGLSIYKDTQTLIIQEFPEKIPTGQLPRSVEVVLEEDLVDSVRPGDRVEVVGIYKAVSNVITNSSGTFKAVVLATGTSSLHTEAQDLTLSGRDVSDIKKIAALPDALEKLGESLAPSIYGHEAIKQALVLLTLGGCEKNLNNGTHLRGDINILLIGDPSTAKSQLLRTVLHTVPLGSCTTGRGSSGVGLTAAIVVDKETGERHLTAGAMVLADRGVICIDEFDKMDEIDRVAIHEVMEQQTVTIAKAGIHTSLNARCSVLAAANPIYGTYASDLPPSKNIALPDSLLSRFDLLFIILDHKASEIDRNIAERVIRNHTSGIPLTDQYDNSSEILEEQVRSSEETRKTWYRSEGRELIHRELLRKFIHYAKNMVKPELTSEASSYIAETWSELRTKDPEGGKRIMPITVRTLETLIRLSTACAKVRLSALVELEHCRQAVALLKFALTQEEETSQSLAIGEAVELVAKLNLKRRREEQSGVVEKLIKTSSRMNSPVSEDMKRQVFNEILRMTEETEMPSANINTLFAALRQTDAEKWTSKELMVTVLKVLERENKVMLQENKQTVTLTVG